ncbi:MAG TPA: carbon storage regulator [Candidatus Ruthenibacterium avium]|uniref:Translational regulator CsrA n=1 Tax=Candidatus Ruthenibacterium avium TaxID=2838751 RepID=A0A9D2M0X9_9FIRM|nr:carbon storage regulator [Candidatus Ruthenibacterium avium]
MLRLNRKKGESIILETPDGHKAQIIITDFSATQVQLGIEAPKGIGVWREEIYDVVSQNRQAAKKEGSTSDFAKQLMAQHDKKTQDSTENSNS